MIKKIGTKNPKSSLLPVTYQAMKSGIDMMGYSKGLVEANKDELSPST